MIIENTPDATDNIINNKELKYNKKDDNRNMKFASIILQRLMESQTQPEIAKNNDE